MTSPLESQLLLKSIVFCGRSAVRWLVFTEFSEREQNERKTVTSSVVIFFLRLNETSLGEASTSLVGVWYDRFSAKARLRLA